MANATRRTAHGTHHTIEMDVEQGQGTGFGGMKCLRIA